MEISLPVATFARFSQIAKTTEKFGVYIEEKDNKRFIVATNKKIACVEFLGEGFGIDSAMCIEPNEALEKQCKIEQDFSSKVNLTYNSMLNFTTCKTDFGFTVSENLMKPINEHFHKWREWFPGEMPKKTKGAMYANFDNIKMIANCAPSGRVVFPVRIDVDFPVVLNDPHDPNWIGAFLPKEESGSSFDGATLPEWLK